MVHMWLGPKSNQHGRTKYGARDKRRARPPASWPALNCALRRLLEPRLEGSCITAK